jgi:hypothetical protein
MSNLRTAAQQALEALEELSGWQSLAPPLASKIGRQAAINLRAALEQPEQEPWVKTYAGGKPNYTQPFTLSCGCPSQYGGIPAQWPVTDREGNPAVAHGVICERHWHEYRAHCPDCEPNKDDWK